MARSAADFPFPLAILDGTYRAGWTAPTPDPAILKGIRVLVIEDLHPVPLDSDNGSVFTETCKLLSRHGAEIIERTWPRPTRPDPYGILAPTLNVEARLRHEKTLVSIPVGRRNTARTCAGVSSLPRNMGFPNMSKRHKGGRSLPQRSSACCRTWMSFLRQFRQSEQNPPFLIPLILSNTR
jgi:Asp-tRNA(Asn)/Glu-tRNA(Gln) amidotransferase A subunit family amidase